MRVLRNTRSLVPRYARNRSTTSSFAGDGVDTSGSVGLVSRRLLAHPERAPAIGRREVILVGHHAEQLLGDRVQLDARTGRDDLTVDADASAGGLVLELQGCR